MIISCLTAGDTMAMVSAECELVLRDMGTIPSVGMASPFTFTNLHFRASSMISIYSRLAKFDEISMVADPESGNV